MLLFYFLFIYAYASIDESTSVEHQFQSLQSSLKQALATQKTLFQQYTDMQQVVETRKSTMQTKIFTMHSTIMPSLDNKLSIMTITVQNSEKQQDELLKEYKEVASQYSSASYDMETQSEYNNIFEKDLINRCR